MIKCDCTNTVTKYYKQSIITNGSKLHTSDGCTRLRILSPLVATRGKCKFSRLCYMYSKTAYTCTHTGGGYCGKYRKFSQLLEEIGEPKNPLVERLVL